MLFLIIFCYFWWIYYDLILKTSIDWSFDNELIDDCTNTVLVLITQRLVILIL